MLSASKSPPQSWSDQALQRLRELADQPVMLVLVLLAANAITRPYANIRHDTLLYSIQVLNHIEHGAYDDDLFFRYGSQDQYSVFSMMMAPLVRLMGLESAFFLVYLAGNALFIGSLMCLIRRLVADRLLAVVSLVYLVIAPLDYGGHSVFHVHEAFLTPRLLATGLILLGLDQLLQGRLALSFALMVLAGLLHPLMAVGGFLMWGGVFLIDKLGWRLAFVALVLLTLVTAAFLATPSLASRSLGEMDDAWRGAILKATPFNFTSEWEFHDWANVFFCGVGIAGGVWLFARSQTLPGNDRRVCFLVTAGLVGIAAVLGTMLAEKLPYALPFQGQPYRALWILEVLQVPLCFMLADRLLRSENLGVALLAFVPLGFLLSSGPACLWQMEWTCPLYLWPGTVIAMRGLERQPRRPDWLIRSLAVSLLLGEMTWCIYRECMTIRDWSTLASNLDTFNAIQVLLYNLGVVPWMLLILGLTAWSMTALRFRVAANHSITGLACLGICLAVQTTFFVLPNTTYFRENGTCILPDILFARASLRQEQTPNGKKPTIYCPFGRVDYVWLEMNMNSYFDWYQTSGVIFRRQTAMEAERRALVVAPFAIERFRQLAPYLDERTKRNVLRFFQIGVDAAITPTVEDLALLCVQPGLDYVILNQEFPGLYSATNGRVYIYDCQKVRTALNPTRSISHDPS